MSDAFWLCLHLDGCGHPCNRRTMKQDLAERFCAEHGERPVPASKPKRGPSAEYQRARRARIAQAGMSPAMEAA